MMSETSRTTPVSSPKLSTKIPLQPSTPSPSKSSIPLHSDNHHDEDSHKQSDYKNDNHNSNIFFSHINTPETESVPSFPYSPSLKRTSSGVIKVPQTPSLTNSNSNPNLNLSYQSPYPLLQTPNKRSSPTHKWGTSPQYFSPRRKDNKSQEELQEISSNLKTRLSYAFVKLQKGWTNESIENLEKNFTKISPNKRDISYSDSNPVTGIGEMRTYESFWGNQSPNKKPTLNRKLLQSPSFTRSPNLSKTISINNEEENSAHNALIAAISRQNHSLVNLSQPNFKPRRTHSRSSSLDTPLIFYRNPDAIKLQPINLSKVKSNQDQTNISFNSSMSSTKTRIISNGEEEGDEEDREQNKVSGEDPNQKNTEQEAILSLMSLSSPRSNKFNESIHSNPTKNVSTPLTSESVSKFDHGAMKFPQANRNLTPNLVKLKDLKKSVEQGDFQLKSDKFKTDDTTSTDDETDIEDDTDIEVDRK